MPVELSLSFSTRYSKAHTDIPHSKDSAFPFPGKPWYGFLASLVGPSLRAPDEEQCISEDMCVPILPDTMHPRDCERARPKPERPFPYDNCYHWSHTDTKIRVLADPEGFDTMVAIKLDVREDTKREKYFSEDILLQQEALKARDGRSSPAADHQAVDAIESRASSSIAHTSLPHSNPIADRSAYTSGSLRRSENDCASMHSYCTYESSVLSKESIDTMTEMGIFGDPSGDIEFQPLVRLWLDLEAHLKQDDIPSPIHFYEEVDAISQ